MRTKLAAVTLATAVAFGGGIALTTPDAQAQNDRSERREQRMQQREERLQQREADGTITAERAAEIRERMAQRQAAREARHQARTEQREALADTLGLTVEELRAERKAGARLADLAEAAGVDLEIIIDQIEAAKAARINDAVAQGRITQERADEKLADLRDRITARLNP